MTDTPHLEALAMRTRAAEAAKARADYWRETSETAKANKNPKEARDWQSMKLAGLFVKDAILALPLEADPAALVAEALKLPEIAELSAAYWKIRSYAVHDDDCTINRYPDKNACSCGLRAALVQP